MVGEMAKRKDHFFVTLGLNSTLIQAEEKREKAKRDGGKKS